MKGKKRDYYVVLGVSKDATDGDIKRAFRDLARKYHPDISDEVGAEERFKEANEAYAVLSDPEARKRYDRFGHSSVERDGFGATVVDAFDDIIGDILRRRRSRKPGRDLRYTLEVTFEEAALGGKKSIKVADPDDKSNIHTFDVTIPSGAEDGSVRMIRGEGQRGADGGTAGDLHVILRVRQHPLYWREGHDVWCEVPVSFPQATLGSVIDVPTLYGGVRMRIPPGTQAGRVFRLRSKGIPRTTGLRGDQMVKVHVETPTDLTPRQRELMESLAEASGEAIAHPQKRTFLDKVKSLF